jgi:hypothetical protein
MELEFVGLSNKLNTMHGMCIKVVKQIPKLEIFYIKNV